MSPIEVNGLKELEIWLKLFHLDNTGLISRKFSSLYEICKQIDGSKNPSTMCRIVVDKAFKMGLIVEKEGFLIIDVDKLSDALAELKIYSFFEELVRYNS